MERLRNLDPIHIYAQKDRTSGLSKEDWVLVVDYHKGAHDIQLCGAQPNGAQTLEITEHDTVFNFDLIAPRDLSEKALGMSLPVVPGRLCQDF